MKKKEAILIFFLLIFLFSIQIKAEIQSLPPVKIGNCVNLPQICSNCSFVNLTYIQYPDKTLSAINSGMQNRGGGYYNYSFCGNNQSGDYLVNGFADPDGIIQGWSYDYNVNPIGKVFTNSQAILYSLIFFVSLILFLICIFSASYLPSKNSKDQMTGYVIAVENLKYVKIFLFAFAYIMLTLMIYFGWMISYGYLDLDFLGNLFNVAFYALLIATVPLFIVGVYVVIANAVRDSKVSELLSRGLSVR